MFNHKEGCPFKDFQRSLTSWNTNGPDVCLTINEDGIFCDEGGDINVPFNYCPYCGVEKE